MYFYKIAIKGYKSWEMSIPEEGNWGPQSGTSRLTFNYIFFCTYKFL